LITNCNVVLDLMPLVIDGVASEDSSMVVKGHIQTCDGCRVEYDSFKSNKVEHPSIKDEKIISGIKRSIFMTQASILIAGAIVGVALTNSMGMFYNIIIMPIIGGISVTTFKRKSYLAAVAVFFLSYLWQTVKAIIIGGFDWAALYSGLFYSIIYMVLVGLGIVIAVLLQFSLGKKG